MKTMNDENFNLIPAGETVIWHGRPKQGLLFCKKDLPLTIVYAIFFAFAVSIASFLLRSTELPLLFDFGGVAFVFVAGYCLFGRFIAEAHLRKRSSYLITDQHLLISFGPYSGRRKSFSLHVAIPELPPQVLDLAELPDVKLLEVDKDGVGTIDFGLPPVYRSFWGGRSGESAVVIYPRLQAIQNADDVYKEILKARTRLIESMARR